MERPSANDSHIVFDHLSMQFGDREVFEDLSCAFPRGHISVLLGGSGSGKSTLLRLIGGLIRPRSGRIEVAGCDVTTATEAGLYEVRERIGMLFQGGALLDSLTIFDNLALPLREHSDLSPAEISAKIHEQLAAVGLQDVDSLLPGQLSGGMLRRAALARAILRTPDILLCDEPFSGLDPSSVKRIEGLIAKINRERGLTVLLASHHIPSTLRLADHALLLLPGRAVSGRPTELRSSEDPEIADFFDEDERLDDLSLTSSEAIRS